MGLISWIKGKYYDSRLDKADRLVSENSLDQAEEIYRSLLGNQDLAIVHLADMFVSHSQGVEGKLKALKDIVDLQGYSNEQNMQDYERCLTTHLNNIESFANDRFRGQSYHDAVLLIDAIQTYRKNNRAYDEKRHRYHAYLAFSKSQQTSSYDLLINETIAELNQYEQSRTSDIRAFVDLLKSKNRYSRIIKLLIPFLSLDKDFKKLAIDGVVNVVLKKDDDVKNPKKISEFCSDSSLCKDAANELVSLSASSAKKSDYKTSVLFDSFASEYFSSDNQFNNTRCVHVLEELSARANATEVKQLLKMAKDLKLTDAQIDSLKMRIAKIAEKADPESAINICRLFISEKTFDFIYINQAENLVSNGNQSKINESELKQLIHDNTDEDTIVDVLSPFVGISSFEKLFYDSAISKIKRHKSMSFLEKYWDVKESTLFFATLISPSSDIAKEVVKFVSDKHKKFLHTKELRTAFCKSLDSLHDNAYAYTASEYLIQKKCDVNSYYVTVSLNESKNKKSPDALSIINHSISVLSDKQLLERKKQIIRQLIKEQDFELSEKEAKSLVGVDNEAETLLAEVYCNKGKYSSETSEKKECYYLVLGLCEDGKVNSSFKSSKEDALKELVVLSRNAYDGGNEQEAYEILDRIKGYQTYWLPLFIELRNRDFSKVSSLGQKIKFEEDTISQISESVENTKDIKDSSYYALWDSYIDLLYNKAKAQPKEKAIDSFIKVRTLLNAQCKSDYAKEKVDILTKDIVKLEWSCATELESDIEYEKAIAFYEAVKSENLSSYKGRAELRSLICNVKSGSIDLSKEQRIVNALDLKSHESLKDDLAYRYACYLLQSTRPADAEKLLKKYLPNETSLLTLCENIYIKESEKYLLEFNKKIKSVIEGTMTVAEATSFLQEIDQYKAKISSKLTDTSSKFNSYKSKLESYILRGMFNEEQYDKAFDKLIAMYPAYIENDNQFRNVAIAALGVVESGKAKEKMLKYAISIWLSAVYTDRLFVKSLDYTSWDDDFTFTLQGSLGQTSDYDYDNLPDNINFDDPVDNHNIAIKDVQVSLSSRMETFIRDNYPKYEQFFTNEKEALDDLMELNLDQDCITASPYLANQLSTVRKSIKEALDYDIAQGYDNEENALDLGVRYGFSGNDYSSYSDAQQKVEKCKSAMSGSVTTIRSAFSSLPQIKNYSKLYASLKSFASSRMNEDIKSKMDYKKFIDVYEIVCKSFNEAPLSLAFSNYANGEIVQRLNDDRMQLRDGVGYMVRVYTIAPSSIQVKQNLEGMLAALAVQAEQNNSSADRTAVDNAVRNTGNAFKSAVEDARVQATLSVIVDKVNSGSMSKDKALKEVYELYKKNPNNDRICQNLVTLCDMCIMEYVIADKWGVSSVKSILDSLNNNKSAAFNRHKDKLAQSYSNIWNQLDINNRMLLMGRSVPGKSLNEKGWALKAGLDYYKKLGDVRSSSSSRLSGLAGLGLFDDLDLPF
jgi:hypothetical protein